MEVALYVADDIQNLASGKLLMVGVYADRRIIMSVPKGAVMNSENKAGVPMLCVLVSVIGVDAGEHKCRAEMYYPDGSPLSQPQETTVMVAPPHRALNFIQRFTPFTFWEEGGYAVHITVDGQEFVNKFDIAFQEIENPVAH